jgi:phosphoribosylformimino-5-aminoimidazole carboxamide ribotide isomerase
MRMLPVIDLKAKLVVRGIAGQRDHYRPIESRIATDPSPGTVAAAFVRRGFEEAYVADLDAIAGADPDFESYSQIASAGLRLMVDAGISSLERAERLASLRQGLSQIESVVVASESIVDTDAARAAWRLFGVEAAIFSLDLKHAAPLVANPNWVDLSAMEILAEVHAIGFRRLIVLDLAAVGTGTGPATLELCRSIRERYSDVEVISGGGVRGPADLQQFADAGCNQVLIASALHDGRLIS